MPRRERSGQALIRAGACLRFGQSRPWEMVLAGANWATTKGPGTTIWKGLEASDVAAALRRRRVRGNTLVSHHLQRVQISVRQAPTWLAARRTARPRMLPHVPGKGEFTHHFSLFHGWPKY